MALTGLKPPPPGMTWGIDPATGNSGWVPTDSSTPVEGAPNPFGGTYGPQMPPSIEGTENPFGGTYGPQTPAPQGNPGSDWGDPANYPPPVEGQPNPFGGKFGEQPGQPPPGDPGTSGGGNPLDTDMDAFRKLLKELNPRFMGVADELQGIAGGEDPRFEAFRQVQVGDASARNAEFFGRRGTSGSTASLNQLQRTTTGINANLGMQQLARQDTARLGSLDVLRGFLENETVPIQLQLQRMAAENAATAAEMAGQQRDPFIKLGPISVG